MSDINDILNQVIQEDGINEIPITALSRIEDIEENPSIVEDNNTFGDSTIESASDYATKFREFNPEAEMDAIGKAYKKDYEKYLKDSGINGAEREGRLSRINNFFENSSDPIELKGLLDSDKQKRLEIPRADKFVEQELVNGTDFVDARENFLNSYSKKLSANGYTDDEIKEKVILLQDKITPTENIEQLKALFTQEEKKTEDDENGFFGNVARNFGKRAANLGGELTGFIDKASNFVEESLGEYGLGEITYRPPANVKEIFTFENFGYRSASENIALKAEGKNPERLTQELSKELRSVNLGYVPQATWDNVKSEFSDNGVLSASAWGETVAYAFEQGVGSIPDMVSAVVALPAYVGARTNEIGEKRATNKGKKEADMVDLLEAAPFAIAASVLERIGAKGVLNAGDEVVENTGVEILKAGFKAGGKEAGTEAFQSGVLEYVGERFGTDAKLTLAESWDQALAGAVAGGITGGQLGTISATAKQFGENNEQPNNQETSSDENVNEPDQTRAGERPDTSGDQDGTQRSEEVGAQTTTETGSVQRNGDERPLFDVDIDSEIDRVQSELDQVFEPTHVAEDGTQVRPKENSVDLFEDTDGKVYESSIVSPITDTVVPEVNPEPTENTTVEESRVVTKDAIKKLDEVFDTSSLANWLKENAESDVDSTIANSLIEIISNNKDALNIPVIRQDTKGVDTTGRVYGENSTLEYLMLSSSKEDLNESNAYRIAMHEMVHVATIHEVRDNEQFKGEMERLLNLSVDSTNSSEYGFTNVDEFMAEAISNKEFQTLLSTIKDPDSNESTLLDVFVQLVRKALKIDNNDASVLDSTNKALNEIILGIGSPLEINEVNNKAIEEGVIDLNSPPKDDKDTFQAEPKVNTQSKPRKVSNNRFDTTVPNRAKLITKTWLTSAGNLPAKTFESFKRSEWENNAENTRVQQNFKELGYTLKKLKSSKEEKANQKEVIMDYLTNPDAREELVSNNKFLQNTDVKNSVDSIRETADRMVGLVSEVVMQTTIQRAKGLTKDSDKTIYLNWLSSVRNNTPYNFEQFDAAQEKVEAFKEDADQPKPTDQEKQLAEFADNHKPVLNSMLLHSKILDSKGSYVNRSFKIHDSESNWNWDTIPEKTKKRAADEVIDNSLIKLKTDEEYRAMRNDTRQKRVDEGNLDDKQSVQFERDTKKGLKELSKKRESQKELSESAKEAGGWRQLIDNGSIVNDDLKGIVRISARERVVNGEQKSALDANAYIQEYVEGHSGDGSVTENFAKGGADARIDMSVLMKRGDLSPAFLDLLGEYKDPEISLRRSISKSANLVQTYETQKKVFDWLEPLGLITAPNDNPLTDDNGKTWAKLPSGTSWEFLADRRVPQYVYDTLAVHGLISGSPQDVMQSPWGSVLLEHAPIIGSVGSRVKGNLVATSLGTVMRNAESAFFMMLPAAQMTPIGIMRNARRLGSSFGGAAGTRNYDQKQIEWQEQGVLNQQIQLRVIKDLQKAANKGKTEEKITNFKAGKNIALSPVRGALKVDESVRGFMTKLFEAGDDYARIFIYESLKEQGKKRGIADEKKLREFASERLNDSYPTYDRAWQLAKQLSLSPVIGNFVTFQSELARTTANNIRHSVQDISLGKRMRNEGKVAEGNEVIKQGVTRGISSVSSFIVYEAVLGSVLTGAVGFITGREDEEERPENIPTLDKFGEAMAYLQPDYARNSNLSYFGVADDNTPVMFDSSRMSGHGAINKAWRAASNKEGFKEDPAKQFSAVVQEILGGAVDLDLGAKTVFEIYRNEDQYNRKIIEEPQNKDILGKGIEVSQQALDYASKNGLTQKIYREIYEVGEAFYDKLTKPDEDSKLGKEVGELFGIKTTSAEIKYLVANRISPFLTEIKKSEKEFKKLIETSSEITDDQIRSEFNKMNEIRLKNYSTVNKIVGLGVDVTAFTYYEGSNAKLKTRIISKAEKYIEEEVLKRVTGDDNRTKFTTSEQENLMKGKTPKLSLSKFIKAKKLKEKAVYAPKGSPFTNPQVRSQRLRLVRELIRDSQKRQRQE